MVYRQYNGKILTPYRDKSYLPSLETANINSVFAGKFLSGQQKIQNSLASSAILNLKLPSINQVSTKLREEVLSPFGIRTLDVGNAKEVFEEEATLLRFFDNNAKRTRQISIQASRYDAMNSILIDNVLYVPVTGPLYCISPTLMKDQEKDDGDRKIYWHNFLTNYQSEITTLYNLSANILIRPWEMDALKAIIPLKVINQDNSFHFQQMTDFNPEDIENDKKAWFQMLKRNVAVRLYHRILDINNNIKNQPDIEHGLMSYLDRNEMMLFLELRDALNMFKNGGGGIVPMTAVDLKQWAIDQDAMNTMESADREIERILNKSLDLSRRDGSLLQDINHTNGDFIGVQLNTVKTLKDIEFEMNLENDILNQFKR